MKNTTTPTASTSNNELPKISVRFLSKLKENTDTGCWEYTGACLKDKNGNAKYGIFWDGNTSRLAHRYAYLTFLSDNIGDNDVIHHTCNNPKCCNWEKHLAVATHKENTAAAKKDGLLAVKRRPYRKATQQEIDGIRQKHAAGVSMYKLAQEYGRSQPYIAAIVAERIHPVDKPTKAKKIIRRRPVPVEAPAVMKEAA